MNSERLEFPEIFPEDCLPPGETDERNFQHFVMLADKAKTEAEKDISNLRGNSRRLSLSTLQNKS